MASALPKYQDFDSSDSGCSLSPRYSGFTERSNHTEFGMHSPFEIANFFIHESNQSDAIRITPMLLEKITVFSDRFSLSVLDQRLIDEPIVEDDFGQNFASLRKYLRFYKQDEIISSCFSRLPAYEDYVSEDINENSSSFNDFSAREKQVLKAVNDYMIINKCNWYDLATNMSEHICALRENWGESLDGT